MFSHYVIIMTMEKLQQSFCVMLAPIYVLNVIDIFIYTVKLVIIKDR